ncbi:MAG: Gfo/Idh/MocA family oxidoreductase [Armatimonadota bacterium]|nr:Gfo/Idh/MocA family oxidoreductase [Armatimonadota bacterium]
MRYVVIGFAHPHIDGAARAFRSLPGLELVGIADSNRQRLEERQALYGVPAFEDYREMLERVKPDFAAISPVNAEKAAVVAECAARGVHVFADKPLYTRRPHVAVVEEAVRRYGIEVWAYLTVRYSPAYYAMKQRIDAGEIGEVVSIYSAGPHKLNLPTRTHEMLDAELNGGVLVDLGSHDFDVARWFTGREPRDVVAQMSNRRFPQVANFYDNAQAFLRFDNGTVAYLEESWLQPDASRFHDDRRTLVVGTLGTLEYRTCDSSLTMVTVSRGEESIPTVRPPKAILEDFVAALRGEGSGTLSTSESLASARVGVFAHEAAITGERVVIP